MPDPLVDLRITGQDKMRALAAELKEAPKELQREIRKSLRGVAAPLTELARENLAEYLPKRGGLSADLSGALKVASTVTGSSNPTLKLKASAESAGGRAFRKARRADVRRSRKRYGRGQI